MASAGNESFSVLCVDSDSVANAAVASVLAGSARLWTAGHFRAAVDAIRERPYDLVICDVTAREARGMEVLSILGSLFPSTPVIATSRRDIGGWTTDALDVLGAFAGMVKPYQLHILREAVCDALKRAHAGGKGELPPCCSEAGTLRGETRTAAEVVERIKPLVTGESESQS